MRSSLFSCMDWRLRIRGPPYLDNSVKSHDKLLLLCQLVSYKPFFQRTAQFSVVIPQLSPLHLSLPVLPHLISAHSLPAPSLQIHHFRRASTARNDPRYFFIAVVYLLVLGPGWDEREVTGG